jgi:hypothetical protein
VKIAGHEALQNLPAELESIALGIPAVAAGKLVTPEGREALRNMLMPAGGTLITAPPGEQPGGKVDVLMKAIYGLTAKPFLEPLTSVGESPLGTLMMWSGLGHGMLKAGGMRGGVPPAAEVLTRERGVPRTAPATPEFFARNAPESPGLSGQAARKAAVIAERRPIIETRKAMRELGWNKSETNAVHPDVRTQIVERGVSSERGNILADGSVEMRGKRGGKVTLKPGPTVLEKLTQAVAEQKAARVKAAAAAPAAGSVSPTAFDESVQVRTSATPVEKLTLPGQAEQIAIPEGKPLTGATGKITEAVGRTPEEKYGLRYRAVELDDLITSNTDNLAENPEYYQALQERQRDKAASEMMMIESKARNLHPDQVLSDAGILQHGTPVVGPDSMVESGNGRVLAFRRARATYPDRWAAYQQRLRERLGEYGMAETDIAGMRDPVIIRERTTPLDPTQRIEFARMANETQILTKSAAETASRDADRITDDMLANFQVGETESLQGAILSRKNQPFVDGFMAGIPETEAGGILDKGGKLSKNGIDRVKNAMFARAFPGEAGDRLLSALAESSDSNIRRIEDGIQSALPRLAAVEGRIRQGNLDPGLSITEDVAKASDMLSRLRREGKSVDGYLAQESFFTEELTPTQKAILQHLDEYAGKSANRVRDYLRGYADEALKQPPPDQGQMFVGEKPTKEAILDHVARTQTGEETALFGAAGAELAESEGGRPAGATGPRPATVGALPEGEGAVRAGAGTATVEGPQGLAVSVERPSGPIPRLKGPGAKALVRLQDIVRKLHDELDVPIRRGKVPGAFRGMFWPEKGVIRSKSLQEFGTITHETGHWLDKRYENALSGNPELGAELDALGERTSKPSYSAAKRRREGVAEYLRRWITDRDIGDLRNEAPQTTAAFENLLSGDKGVQQTLSETRGLYQEYQRQTTVDRFKASIVTEAPKERAGIKKRWNRFYTAVVERGQPIWDFQKEAIKRHPNPGSLTPEDLPYEQWRLLAHNASRGAQWLKSGAQNFQWETTGKPLAASIRDLSPAELGDLDALLKARRIADWYEKKPAIAEMSGFTPEECAQVIADVNDPKLTAAADAVVAFNDSLLQYKVESGLISEKTAQVLRETERFYVPLRKPRTPGVGELAAEMSPATRQGKSKIASTATGIRKLRGGAEATFSPLAESIGNMYETIALAEKHAVVDAVGRLADSVEGAGKLAERIPLPVKRIPVPKEAVNAMRSEAISELINAGVPKEEALKIVERIGADLPNVFRPNLDAPGMENTIIYRRGDDLVAYQLDADLYQALQMSEPLHLGLIGKMLFLPQYILRTGVVENPGFALANVTKDMWEYALKSRGGARPTSIAKGIFQAFGRGELFDDFQRAGSDFGGFAAMTPDAMKLQLDDITAHGARSVGRALVSPLRDISQLVNASERIARIAEFDTWMKKLEVEHPDWSRRAKMIKAGYEAADLLDFMRTGAAADVQLMRKGVAFFNPAIQGTDRFFRMMKEQPVKATMIGMATITAPVVACYLRNRNNPYYWTRPQAERDMHLLIPRRGGTSFYRIPLPFDSGFVFGTLALRALQYLDAKDPKALDAVSLGEATERVFAPPLIPAAIGPIWDIARNKSWYGSPIVSPYDALDQIAAEQGTERTSTTAKKLGKLIHVSPAKVEYAVRGYTSKLGEIALEGSDALIWKLTGEAHPKRPGIPWFRRFVTQPGLGAPELEDFYAHWDTMRRARNSINRATDEGRDQDAADYERTLGYSEDKYDELSSAAEDLADLRADYRETTNEKKRADIAVQMQRTAMDALNAIGKPIREKGTP